MQDLCWAQVSEEEWSPAAGSLAALAPLPLGMVWGAGDPG